MTRLNELLAQLYPGEDDARRVVAQAGVRSERIEFSSAAETNWFNILQEAARQTRVDRIVAIAREEYQERPEWAEIAVSARGGTAAPDTETDPEADPDRPTKRPDGGGGTVRPRPQWPIALGAVVIIAGAAILLRWLVTVRGTFIAVNSPLFNQPELVDQLAGLAFIPTEVAKAYRKLAAERKAKR